MLHVMSDKNGGRLTDNYRMECTIVLMKKRSFTGNKGKGVIMKLVFVLLNEVTFTEICGMH